MEEAAHSLLIAYDKSHARRAKQVSKSNAVGVEVLVLKFSRNGVLELDLVQWALRIADPQNHSPGQVRSGGVA
jgi:hypothetical protein